MTRPYAAPAPSPRRPSPGFTLVELMITLAVLAILAAIAWPNYRDAVLKGRRADAMAALTQVMQAAERYRSNHASYYAATSSALADIGVAAASPDGHYDLAIVAGSAADCPSMNATRISDATTYVATATARAGGAQAGDAQCKLMSVAMCGGSLVYRSARADGSVNASPDPCWIK